MISHRPQRGFAVAQEHRGHRDMNCRLVFKTVQANVKLEDLVQYYSSLPNPSILGAADFISERNRYSYFCAEPVEIFEFKHSDEKPFEKLKGQF